MDSVGQENRQDVVSFLWHVGVPGCWNLSWEESKVGGDANAGPGLCWRLIPAHVWCLELVWLPQSMGASGSLDLGQKLPHLWWPSLQSHQHQLCSVVEERASLPGFHVGESQVIFDKCISSSLLEVQWQRASLKEGWQLAVYELDRCPCYLQVLWISWSCVSVIVLGVAITNYHSWMAYKQQKLISHRSGSWKSEIRYQCGWVLVGVFFLVHRWWLFTAFSHGGSNEGPLWVLL